MIKLPQIMFLNIKKKMKQFHTFSRLTEPFESTFSNHIHPFDLQCIKKWILNKLFPGEFSYRRPYKLLMVCYNIFLTFSHGLQVSKKIFVDKKSTVKPTINLGYKRSIDNFSWRYIKWKAHVSKIKYLCELWVDTYMYVLDCTCWEDNSLTCTQRIFNHKPPSGC